jgi:hypothetical protein
MCAKVSVTVTIASTIMYAFVKVNMFTASWLRKVAIGFGWRRRPSRLGRSSGRVRRPGLATIYLRVLPLPLDKSMARRLHPIVQTRAKHPNKAVAGYQNGERGQFESDSIHDILRFVFLGIRTRRFDCDEGRGMAVSNASSAPNRWKRARQRCYFSIGAPMRLPYSVQLPS